MLPQLNIISERRSKEFSGQTETKFLSYENSSNSLSQTYSQDSKQIRQAISFNGAPRNTGGTNDGEKHAFEYYDVNLA